MSGQAASGALHEWRAFRLPEASHGHQHAAHHDGAADVVGELQPHEAEAILVEMEHEEARDVRDLLAYPPESAAGIMTPDFVAVAPYLTVDEALEQLGRVAEEAETIYYVYVTD